MAVQQQKENYQRILDKTIEQLGKEGKVPSLLLHSCCAPCSSYVLEYLSEYFKITVLYYNPNISPKEEYEARVREQKRLIGEMDFTYPVALQKLCSGEIFMKWQKDMKMIKKKRKYTSFLLLC